MLAEEFELNVPEHTIFLDGYLDAVGRILTTDTELWALTARDSKDCLEGDMLFGVSIDSQSVVDNWSREFVTLISDFLGIDRRSRLGFYLADYICLFRDFNKNATCLKLGCASLGRERVTIGQAVYLLQIDANQAVLLLFQHLVKGE